LIEAGLPVLCLTAEIHPLAFVNQLEKRMIPPSDRLLLFAARCLRDLQAQLAVDDESLLERDDIHCPPLCGPYRLAIVNPNVQRLSLARRVLEGGTPWRGRKDVWFTPLPLIEESSERVAFIFPGLEQRFDPVLDDVAAHFDLPFPDLKGTEESVRQHSIALLSTGQLLDRALRRIGVEPAAIAGHSIGEWNAMVSAGMISSTSLDSFLDGVTPEVFNVPNCVFVAIGAGVEIAESAVDGVEGAVVSHDNCPHQSIICGDQDAIAIAMQRLSDRCVPARLLNFRSGFHSPFLAPHLDWVSGIARLPIEPVGVRLWSATTTRPFPEEEKSIRELIVRHLLEPVHFRELIENLYASGIRAFVQVGVGSTAGFIDDTLTGRGYTTIAANVAGQPGMRQLYRVAAALWVEGAQPRFDRLALRERHAVVAEDQIVA
jgi:acyl transferase domain-containing protein